jgi:AcrR family transcriptional regulator
MGRKPQPDIADRLLEACTDFALSRGLPDRLEPLVAATGTSSRMLLYHFGSRDDLLRAILRRARHRQVTSFRAWMQRRPDEHYITTLANAWASMTGPEGQPYVRMFTQLRENAEQNLWPGFRRIATTDWLEPLEDGLSSIGLAGSATLVLAVMRGLLMDLDATADTARADRAFGDFLALLDAAPRPASEPS